MSDKDDWAAQLDAQLERHSDNYSRELIFRCLWEGSSHRLAEYLKSGGSIDHTLRLFIAEVLEGRRTLSTKPATRPAQVTPIEIQDSIEKFSALLTSSDRQIIAAAQAALAEIKVKEFPHGPREVKRAALKMAQHFLGLTDHQFEQGRYIRADRHKKIRGEK